ncbi:Fic family protein [Patescibacteria group bacterium]|nr:Fic family protein [Patescibacteria group bacterium]
MIYKINLPNIANITTERILELLKKKELRDIIFRSMHPDYLCWDKFKYNKSIPTDIKPEEAWALVKYTRNNLMFRYESKICDKEGKIFSWLFNLPKFEQFFHEIDLDLGGNLLTAKKDIDDQLRHKFMARGIMEEAIASSQLEGANTSRKIAKQMIVEGRKPKTKDEKMILNSYQAMKLVEEELKDKKLSYEGLMQLHEIITKGTLDDIKDEGRIRAEGDKVFVMNSADGTIYHVAPDHKFVKKEIEKLIAYANDELEDNFFVHPVIKAILLHFWVGYLHPFADGNGRLARVLFYWYLLRKNYWGFAYLPLSKIIKNSWAQYRDAYIYSEQDDNDLTYFIDYNIRKIQQAKKEFENYVEDKKRENLKMAKISQLKYGLNERQINLLKYFYKSKNTSTTIKIYLNINEISRGTAISDLKELIGHSFLSRKKIGKEVHFYPTDKVAKLFN